MTATAAAKSSKDNIFGICNAVGTDFGFNPFFLRLAFAVTLLFRPELTLASYFGLGLIVLASHMLIRGRRSTHLAASETIEQPWTPAIPEMRVATPVAAKALEAVGA